jgi:glycosyltransferase involved in cell wall biosynthesis
MADDIVRFYPQVRTAHMERAQSMASATYLYLSRRADFDPAIAAFHPEFQRGTTASIAVRVFRRPPRVLEAPEPMWLRFALSNIIVCFAARAGAKLRGRTVKIVAYAIENASLESRPERLRRLPARIWRSIYVAVARAMCSPIDEIAFGTPSARLRYFEALSKAQRLRFEESSRTIIALAPACECDNSSLVSATQTVLFVGSLEPRKGFDLLAAAWPDVALDGVDANLLIIGSGPLEPLAEQLANDHANVSFLGAPPRDEVHRAYRASSLVVLPSQPSQRWREQVGLPIVEALAHGCQVLTTDQTGLAPWLETNGFSVLRSPFDTATLAGAISRLVAQGAHDPDSILNLLPSVDGRVQADAWLVRRDDADGSSDRGLRGPSMKEGRHVGPQGT